MVKGLSGKMRFLVMFQYECDKDTTSNQLTVVTVDNRPTNEEAKVITIDVITDRGIDL